MRLTYRPITAWPGQPTAQRKPNPFDSTWTATLELLDRELRALDVTEAVLQVDSPNERDFRLDGQLRAGTKLRGPGVILSFTSPTTGDLTFPCDTYTRNGYRDRGMDGWQINVRAITLGLEALRRLDRYGITPRHEQYTGWRQLGAGTPMPAAQQMTPQDAAETLAGHARIDMDGGPEYPYGPAHGGWAVLLADPDQARRAYLMAARATHPDTGGTTADFQQVEAAWRVLTDHHARR